MNVVLNLNMNNMELENIKYVRLIANIAGYKRDDIAKVIGRNKSGYNTSYLVSVPFRTAVSRFKPYVTVKLDIQKLATETEYLEQLKKIYKIGVKLRVLKGVSHCRIKGEIVTIYKALSGKFIGYESNEFGRANSYKLDEFEVLNDKEIKVKAIKMAKSKYYKLKSSVSGYRQGDIAKVIAWHGIPQSEHVLVSIPYRNTSSSYSPNVNISSLQHDTVTKKEYEDQLKEIYSEGARFRSRTNMPGARKTGDIITITRGYDGNWIYFSGITGPTSSRKLEDFELIDKAPETKIAKNSGDLNIKDLEKNGIYIFKNKTKDTKYIGRVEMLNLTTEDVIVKNYIQLDVKSIGLVNGGSFYDLLYTFRKPTKEELKIYSKETGMDTKYEVEDIARITDNTCGHQFSINDLVEVTHEHGEGSNHYTCKLNTAASGLRTSGIDSIWNVVPSDMELVRKKATTFSGSATQTRNTILGQDNVSIPDLVIGSGNSKEIFINSGAMSPDGIPRVVSVSGLHSKGHSIALSDPGIDSSGNDRPASYFNWIDPKEMKKSPKKRISSKITPPKEW